MHPIREYGGEIFTDYYFGEANTANKSDNHHNNAIKKNFNWGGIYGLLHFALFLPPARKLQNRSCFSNLRRGAAATLCSSPGELIWRILWPPVRGNHRHRHHHRLSITPP